MKYLTGKLRFLEGNMTMQKLRTLFKLNWVLNASVGTITKVVSTIEVKTLSKQTWK